MTVRLLCAALAGVAGLAVGIEARGQAAVDDSVELPVRDIVLYRSGVGYFERVGLVDAGDTVQLAFDRQQISDILKSLVVLTGDGLSIGGVTYDSEEPLARKLASYGIDVSDEPSMAKILSRLRGEEVLITVSGAVKKGVIVGVERGQRVVRSGDNHTPMPTVKINLLRGAVLDSIPLDDVSGLELADDALAQDLADALAAIASDRNGGLATVRVGVGAGEGTGRGVRIGYVHEMPVWKTTYRLVLPELSGGSSDDEVLLQGWAIVENTTDTDWNDVQLSLAAGQPSSFRMDLYSPVFRARPEVPVPLGASFVAKAFDAIVDRMGARPSLAVGSMMPPETAARGRGGGVPEAQAAPDLAFNAETIGSALATGAQRGAQFFYTVDGEVDVPRKTSAMLPMLVTEVPGERVSIYNPQDSRSNPVFGVRFENESGLHLLPGPVTVVDGGAYAGDAQIDHTSRGETQLLSYAMDVDVNASVDRSNSDVVESLTIVNGSLIRQTKSVMTSVYTFTNDDSVRGRKLIIEHPKTGRYELVSPRGRDVESTDSAYRVRIDLDRSGDERVEIVEERVYRTSLAVTSLDLDTLLRYERSGRVSDDVANAVRRAAQLQADKRNLEQERDNLLADRRRHEQDQSRARQNLDSFDRGSDGRQRFVQKLLDAESEIERIDRRRTELTQQIASKDAELRLFLRNLNLR